MLLLLCIMLDSDPDRRDFSLSQDSAFSGSADQCKIREVDVCVFTDWAKTPSVTQSPYSGLALCSFGKHWRFVKE